MSDGVTVWNRLFVDESLNSAYTGFLVILSVVSLEQIAHTVFFSGRRGVSRTTIHRHEIYTHLAHVSGLTKLLRGTDWSARQLGVSRLQRRDVHRHRMLVPLSVRLVVLAAEFLLIVFGGTRQFVVTGDSQVPLLPQLDVPGVSNGGCRQYLPDVRGSTARGRVEKCVRSGLDDDEIHVGGADVPAGGWEVWFDSTTNEVVFHVKNISQNFVTSFDIAASYTSLDRTPYSLLLFHSISSGLSDNANASFKNFTFSFRWDLHDAIGQRLAARTGAPTNTSLRRETGASYISMIEGYIDPSITVGALNSSLFAVLDEDLGLVAPGDSTSVVALHPDGKYKVISSTGHYSLAKNKLDNIVLLGIALVSFALSFILKSILPVSAPRTVYDKFLAVSQEDTSLGPAAARVDEQVLRMRWFQDGKIGHVGYSPVLQGQTETDSFEGCEDVR